MNATLKLGFNPLPPIFKDIPVIYEDDEHEETLMGENTRHYEAGGILFYCLDAHLTRHYADLRAFCNLNCYYLDKPKSKTSGRRPYFSADVMISRPKNRARDLRSYTIGKDGPSPIFVCEILSQLSGKIRDPIEKPEIYAKLGVVEYLLIDELGRFLPQTLLLKRLRQDRSWEDSIDADGGITSQLGFRVVHDGTVRVVDANTGKPYVRPGEAELEIERIEEVLDQSEAAREQIEAALAKSEAENRALRAKLAALRKKPNGGNASK
jgi:Uma2 family endonuclease